MFCRQMAKRRQTERDETRAERDETRAERDETRAERQRMTIDEDGIFGQQVATIMRRFSNIRKSTARIKVLQLLHDIEFFNNNDERMPISYSQQ